MNVAGTLRNDAHTGERRCVPCTIVNLVILWIVVNGVALVGSLLAGGVVLVVGLVVIWLRGYLVPYTPEFAPRLVAASPLPETWFHDTETGGTLSSDADGGDAVIERLARVGVLEADDERVYLDRTFEERWHEEMADLTEASLSELADRLEALPSVSAARPIEQNGKQWIAVDGQTSLVPRHVAVAEFGAVRALDDRVDQSTDRLALARPLREFLTECPVCGTPFERSTEVSCCGGHTTPRETPRETLVCPECEQRFLRLPDPSESA